MIQCAQTEWKSNLGANNNGTTTVALTKENLDTYFNITQTGTYGTYRQDYTISFKGVLTFAVYENVVITLNMHIYGEGDDLHYLSKNNDYERQLKLNAAGEGTSVLSYEDGKIDGVVDTGLGYDNLHWYECTWSIKALSGNVKYRLWCHLTIEAFLNRLWHYVRNGLFVCESHNYKNTFFCLLTK